MNKKRSLIIISLIIIMGIILDIMPVYGRLGGGENYVPKHSNNFSYSSSSYGNWDLGFLIIMGIVIFAIVAYLKKTGKWNEAQKNLQNKNIKTPDELITSLISATIGTGMKGSDSIDIENGLKKIKEKDPYFNEQVFKDTASTAFFKLQEAWERQDLSIMRPYVTDSILQRFANQINDLKSRGEKNILENIVIGHIEITDIKSDANFDYITVRIDASAIDYTVNGQGSIIRGDKIPRGFSEFWTFLRSATTQTHQEKLLKDNKCPNCGAPLDVNATGKCNYCGAIITSGQFDWVLSEIAQV